MKLLKGLITATFVFSGCISKNKELKMKTNDYFQINNSTNVLLLSKPVEESVFFKLFIERNGESYKVPMANNEYCVKIISANNSNIACALLDRYEGNTTDIIQGTRIISLFLPSVEEKLKAVVVKTIIESNNFPDEKLAVSNIENISPDGKYLFFTGGIRKTIDGYDVENRKAFKMEWGTYKYDFKTEKIEKP